jgi:hypothetical protein
MRHAPLRPTSRAPSQARLGFGLCLMLAGALPQAALALPLEGCATFTTCTVGLRSTAAAVSQYIFANVQPGYVLPASLAGGVNNFIQDVDVANNLAQRVSQGELCVNCGTSNPFHVSAVARVQSDFGLNRAAVFTSYGASGTDSQAGGQRADVTALSTANATSKWRDVWSFDRAGHFSAVVALDGQASTVLSNPYFPSSFVHGPAVPVGNWAYDLDVWDVTHLVPDPDGFENATLVAHVDGGGSNSFASTLALDFDFSLGTTYVVTTRLSLFARDGRALDLFNTARLQDVVLSGGAAMATLSGHNYLAPVPEPQPASLLALGLAALLWCARRRSAGA